MDRYNMLNILLSVSVLSCLCLSGKVEVPESVTAVEGICVILPCSTSPHSHVDWYKHKSWGYPAVYSKSKDIIEEFRGRTSVPGDPSKGNCSLRIDRVSSVDNGIKLYPWIHPETDKDYHNIIINVVKPETPIISIQSSQVEGKLFSASCSVRHSCLPSPPPIKWLGLSPDSTSVTIKKDQDGLWTSVAQAKFRPNRQDHNKLLSCKSTFGTQTLNSIDLQLDVSYAPTDVKIQAERTSVVEGGTLSLNCSGTSRPPPRYEWSVTQMNTMVKYEAAQRITLQNIKRDSSVSCTVYNSIGRVQSEQLKLTVQFPPKILPTPECSGSPEGIRCVCRAEAEPKASITWTVNGSSTRFPYFKTTSYTGAVVVSELTGPPIQNLSCEASNSLSTDIHHIAVQVPVSEGNSMIFIIAGVAAVVAVGIILGVIVMAVHLRKRQKAGSSENPSRSAGMCYDNHYGKDATVESLYANTVEAPTEKVKRKKEKAPNVPNISLEIMNDIYENE